MSGFAFSSQDADLCIIVPWFAQIRVAADALSRELPVQLGSQLPGMIMTVE
jgi:hypothetical protein